MQKYSLKKGLLKTVKYVCIFGLPFLATQIISAHPDLMNLSLGQIVDQMIAKLGPSFAGLTLGGAITFLVNFLKVWGQKIDG